MLVPRNQQLRGAGKYCSTDCYNRHGKAQMAGDKNPNWSGVPLRDQRRLSEARRRAARRNSDGDVTVAEWEAIKAAYGYRCPRCFRCEPEISLSLDHVVPLARGGAHTPDNIQPLCRTCNTAKYTDSIRFYPDGSWGRGPCARAQADDLARLVTSVAAGEQPLDAIAVNHKTLASLARSLKGSMSIPGVRVYPATPKGSTA